MVTESAGAAEDAGRLIGDPIDGVNAMLGARLLEAEPDRVVITCTVTPALRRADGLVHPGVHSTLVETAASVGAALWYRDGRVVGVENHTTHFQLVRAGELRGTARPVDRSAERQLWRVDIRQGDTLVAQGEVLLANLSSARAPHP